jgi:hypothetical protein
MFKLDIAVTKAKKEDDKYKIGGLASGSFIDSDGDVVSREALQIFQNSLPLPLTNSHITIKVPGEIMGELGTVTVGQIIDKENDEYDFMIEAELDMDNPASPYFFKKMSQGKQYGFSIEGRSPSFEYELRGDKPVRIIKSLIPTSISLTTKPSYQYSIVESISKSLDETELASVINIEENNLIVKDTNMDTTETTTVTESVETPVVAETVTTEVTEVVQTTVETPEVIAEPTKETTTTEVAETSAIIGTPAGGNVVQETEITKSFKSLEDKMETIANVLASLHKDVELLKAQPQAKKSMVVQKSFEDRKEEKKEPAIKGIASWLAGE